MNTYDLIFQNIDQDAANKNKTDHVATVSCVRVLSEIVKPAIKELASSEYKPYEVDCNEEELSIRVNKSNEDFDELIFICVDGEFRAATFIKGRISGTETRRLEVVSSTFVARIIENFLRRSLSLPKSKGLRS